MQVGVLAEDIGPWAGGGGIIGSPLYHALAYILCTGVAPITQYTHVGNKNSNIKGRSPNVVKVIFIP